MKRPPPAGGNDASERGPRRLPDDDAPDRLTGRRGLIRQRGRRRAAILPHPGPAWNRVQA